jgi:2-hydroxychromene-2-carboxylate isomerase
MALVIVQPLLSAYITQEARRNTESHGACDEFASVIHQVPTQIKDGAVLNLFAAGHAGSLASSFLAGILETTWN